MVASGPMRSSGGGTVRYRQAIANVARIIMAGTAKNRPTAIKTTAPGPRLQSLPSHHAAASDPSTSATSTTRSTRASTLAPRFQPLGKERRVACGERIDGQLRVGTEAGRKHRAVVNGDVLELEMPPERVDHAA